MADDDPIVQYVIVRESLNMTPGKACAQCAHAVEGIMLEFFKLELVSAKKKLEIHLPDDIAEHIHLTAEWIAHGRTKIILRANNEEFEKLKAEFDHNCYVVTDAGRTEVAPGTQTVIALWPQYKNQVSKTIRYLPLY
jgi:PTH2 family peptidyl-tRNA hydrolase